MKILVTGCAGFIGAKVSELLIKAGNEVIGIDNLNDYYDVSLKKARLEQLEKASSFTFFKLNLADHLGIHEIFSINQPNYVIHLAAQAGVRYSLENPQSYVESNLVSFVNILEACRQNNIKHLVYASSSSVYGANTHYPYSEKDRTDHPVSLYAATKKSNELLAHSYSSLYQLPVTGLRFFTVYGPWGRPDMAPIKFAQAICQGQAIPVHNHGHHQRDFTYIDDIAVGTIQAMHHIAKPNPQWDGKAPESSSSSAPYRIYNIGYGRAMPLMHFIELLEQAIGKKAILDFKDKQPGDVDITFSDTSALECDVGYKPQISLEVGIPKFVEWFRAYYQN